MSPAPVSRLRRYLDLVRFSHTIFALPFALMAIALASPSRPPPPRTWGWILVCMVAARTAAMAYNRLVDRDVDAQNPRTRERHLPAGRLRAGEVAALVVVSSALFVFAASRLNRLALFGSGPVLIVLLGYSHTKRFTVWCHAVLGLALGLAPLGAWIAVRGTFSGDLEIPLLLGGAVLLWVAGFDILYAMQDVDFDRRAGLRSLPARLGVRRALWISRACHAGMIAGLLWLSRAAGLRGWFLAGVALAGLLLIAEHMVVRPDDWKRIHLAFFTVNGWVGVLLGACTLLEIWG